MTDALIACRSVTYTQRGTRVLNRAGIRAHTKRLTVHLPETGCGYAIRVQLRDLQAALEALRTEGFPAEVVYGDDDGKWVRI